MISEAMGKILGMAMAYGVSALGLFLAYVNYRRRIVKADRVMTPAAWAVVAATVVAVALGAAVVARLTPPTPAAAAVESAGEGAAEEVGETEPGAPDAEAEDGRTAPERTPAADRTATAPPSGRPDRPGWSWSGVLVPAAIFLAATWVTAALHRRFSRSGPP